MSCGGLEAKMKVWRVLEAAAAVVVEREEMWLHLRPREGTNCLVSCLGTSRRNPWWLFAHGRVLNGSKGAKYPCGVTPSNLSMQRNVEYPRALHYWVNSTRSEH
ncbi:hypothetical protein Tco_0470293, partial [Tanacetum coccineum]